MGSEQPTGSPKWPYRYRYVLSLGYVVWRDVFEGQMRCSLHDAVLTHKVAVFVCESEASDYCAYRNEMTVLHGTDSIEPIGRARAKRTEGVSHG